MIFNYKATNKEGQRQDGSIEAISRDLAIDALQRRELIVELIKDEDDKSVLQKDLFAKVKMKEIVILSRQISTLFGAQVSALKAFSLVADGSTSPLLSKKLNMVVSDLKAGFSISGALSKHPDVFSAFYTNMVKSAEESGKMSQTFAYLAAYLDRQYAITSKTRNALVYPVFVIIVFIAVMVLMLTMVIPKLSQLIIESGQQIPIYTKIVINISNFFVDYGIIFLIFVIGLITFLGYFFRTEKGKYMFDNFKIKLPLFGNLYRKMYLSRIADNMDTMLSSGIQIIRAVELTADVVDNKVYKTIMLDAKEKIKAGVPLSEALSKYEEIPHMMYQMIRVGEETGSTGSILKTLADFYRREVDDAVDTLVGLIEPIMVIALGVGVGVLLASVLVPIYNIAGSIQ